MKSAPNISDNERVKKEDELLAGYLSRFLGKGMLKTREDIMRHIDFIKKRKDGAYLREADLEMARLEKGLSPKEIETRDELIKMIESHHRSGSAASLICSKAEDCPNPELAASIRTCVQIMGKLTSMLSLADAKRLLTPREYSKFMPIYTEFKEKGEFTMSFRG